MQVVSNKFERALAALQALNVNASQLSAYCIARDAAQALDEVRKDDPTCPAYTAQDVAASAQDFVHDEASETVALIEQFASTYFVK